MMRSAAGSVAGAVDRRAARAAGAATWAGPRGAAPPCRRSRPSPWRSTRARPDRSPRDGPV
eukprot:5610058-Prymnesium_polylepis.1